MGTFNNGVLGGFSGKVGPVIGSQWRGKNVMRSIQSKITHPPSTAQQLQRDKFKFVLQFLTPIKSLLTETFGANVGVQTPFNRAMSYHLTEAVTYTDMEFEMAYSKVLIGTGSLCGINGATLHDAGTGTLNLTWQDNSHQGRAYPTDELLVVAYAPTIQEFDFFMAYTTRETKACTLDFKEIFYGETVHIWATFINIDQTNTATSSYLGPFTV